jgi:hypothetical protein
MRDFPYSYPYMWNIFHILGIITPTDELIFFRGVGQPPTSKPCKTYSPKHLAVHVWARLSSRARPDIPAIRDGKYGPNHHGRRGTWGSILPWENHGKTRDYHWLFHGNIMEYGDEKWHLNQFLGQSTGWVETNPN